METLQELPEDVQLALLNLYKGIYIDCEELYHEHKGDIDAMAESVWDSVENIDLMDTLAKKVAIEVKDRETGVNLSDQIYRLQRERDNLLETIEDLKRSRA